MERLTERVFALNGTSCMQIKACGNDTCDETCRNITGEKGCKDCPIQIAIDKLAEYEDLEEQNRLLKLPCAVLDEFYCIWRNKGQNPIQKMQVKKIEIHERKGIVIQMEFVGNRGCLFRFYEDDFGKTVFLTGEEAEAALKELERGKGE